jgi:hypothetical protein
MNSGTATPAAMAGVDEALIFERGVLLIFSPGEKEGLKGARLDEVNAREGVDGVNAGESVDELIDNKLDEVNVWVVMLIDGWVVGEGGEIGPFPPKMR